MMTQSNDDGFVNGIDPKRTRAILDLIKKDATGDFVRPQYQTTIAWDSDIMPPCMSLMVR
jgi:hypothetical protein